MDNEMQTLYRQAYDQYKATKHIKDIWEILHTLAEAHDPETLHLLQDMLGSTEWDIRDEAVQLIGFHYSPLDPELLHRFETMLMDEPYAMVRISLASVLGLRSRWPNTTLIYALQHDPDSDVRVAAFEAILRLQAIPITVIDRLREIAMHYDNLPNSDDFQALLESQGLSSALLRASL